MKFYYTVFLIVFLCINQTAFCAVRPFTLGIQSHYGFIINHSPKGGVSSGYSLGQVYGAELQVEWSQSGEKSWHKTYRFPKWGLSILVLDLLEKRYGGYLVSTIAHQSIRVLKINALNVHFRLGTGLGYTAFPYHAEYNPKNMWLSTYVSPIMHGQIETQYSISSNFFLLATGAYTHMSNGNLRRPNLGINIPTLSIGLRYLPKIASYTVCLDTTKKYPTKRDQFHIQLSGGTKTLPEFGTAYYPVIAGSLQYGRRVAGVSKLLLSLDFFRDFSIKHRNFYTDYDINRYGILIAHEWVFGRLSLYAGPGFYLYKKSDFDPFTYIKVGIRHHLSMHVYSGVVLKTHYGQADFFEWSLGYTY